MREQAALSASEITADAVNNFVADLVDESDSDQPAPSSSSEDSKPVWKKILSSEKLSFVNKNNDDLMHVQSAIHAPKINGKHNRTVQKLGIKINGCSTIQGDSFTEFMHPSFPTYKEVLPSLEHWKTGKIAAWHNTEGSSVQWFCILCIDRKGNSYFLSLLFIIKGIYFSPCNAAMENLCFSSSFLHPGNHCKIGKKAR